MPSKEQYNWSGKFGWSSRGGISVKRYVLCAVLIAFIGAVAAAQDGSSENKNSKVLTTTGSRLPWSLLPKRFDRPPTPFITFLEASPSSTLLENYDAADQLDKKIAGDQSFHWSTAIKQSLVFLGVQHGYAMTQPKTRLDLSGPFLALFKFRMILRG